MDEREFEEHDAEMHGRNNMGGFVAGLLIGALAGAATMLLMAPQSGEATREKIREKTLELKDQVAESADEARQRAATTLEDVKGRVGKMQQRGQEMLEEQRSRVSEAMEAGKQTVRRR